MSRANRFRHVATVCVHQHRPLMHWYAGVQLIAEAQLIAPDGRLTAVEVIRR